MKYESPELTALTPAIEAIQYPAGPSNQMKIRGEFLLDNVDIYEEYVAGYMDWED